MVEVLADYSKRARFKLDELSTVRDALDRIDVGKLRRPPTKNRRPSHRYQAGEMSTALAKESGIAKSTFLRLLTERGVRARPRGLTPAKEKEILCLREQGMIIRNIAKQVGCSYDTARLFLLSQNNS